MTQMQEKARAPRRRRKTLFRILVIVLMLVIVGLLLWLLFGQEKESPLEASIKASLGQLDGKSEAEIQAELNRVIEEGMFHIAINADPSFANGRAEGNLEIENVPNNRYAMRVEIALQEDGRKVYDSGLIYPNYHIQRDVLKEALAAGNYPAIATFYAYDVNTLTEMGTVSTMITIHVLY